LAALVPASDELIEDTTALDAFIGPEAGRAIRYKADDAIINGDGVGKPLGILNAAALVTVTKETSQTADTLVAENVAKIYARMPAPYINKAVWLINQDVLPQLLSMTLGDHPIYLPPNGITDAPFGTLLGRPVHLSQHTQTLGDVGDIMFADLSQYLTLTKADGLRASSSVHLWFDYDVTAFRFTFRLAGQPWLSAAITPDNSTASLSPFVTLAARA
jgi:HK97 family phage major capsid protein